MICVYVNFQCKRKHTLVCPDFSKTGSCPRGARCKLHHRLRAKRSASNTSTTPAKKARTKEASKRFKKQSTRVHLYHYKSSSAFIWLIKLWSWLNPVWSFLHPPGPVCLSSCLRTLLQLQVRPLWVLWNCHLSSLSPAPRRRQTHQTHCQSKPRRLKVTEYKQTGGVKPVWDHQ